MRPCAKYTYRSEVFKPTCRTLLDAEAKLGELLSEDEHRGGSNTVGTSHPLPKGISKNLSSQCQQLADHLEPV